MKGAAYLRSFIFGIKLLTLLCLLVAPLILLSLSIAHGSALLSKVPLLYEPGLSIISIQSFPHDSNDPLGLREAEKQPVYLLKAKTTATRQLTREQARQELTRRELERQSLPADFLRYSGATSSLPVDLYVRTNRATTGTTEHSQLKEQAERILNDSEIPRTYPEARGTPPAKSREELAVRLAKDPDFKALSPDEQKRVFEELAKDTQPGPFILRDIPNYMRTVIAPRPTSLGDLVNWVGLIALTILCLALYFPLVTSIVRLVKHRR